MYSDSPYEELNLNSDSNSIDFSSAFDINAYAASPSYHNPLLQTAPRPYETGMYQYNAMGDGGDFAIGNTMLGSPAPSTVKKLKSNLAGVGMDGGYLCSPVGGSKATSYASMQQLHQPSFIPESTSVPSPVKIGNLPTMPIPSQPMQRLRSAPASLPVASTSSSAPVAGPSTRRKASGKTNNNNVPVPVADPAATTADQQAVGLGIPEAGFNELDYGSMRIYGRPLARSASADPALRSANSGSGTFLPYPEHLPTVTLGRGMKNTRDVAAPVHSEVFPKAEVSASNTQSSAPVMKQSNLDKPYIQYVPPDSPAAKSAMRNRNNLSINTGTGKAVPSGKLVPVRMSPKKHMPLTPPMTSTSILSPNLVPVPYNSPQKAAAMGYHGHNQVQTAPMPSFEFSLEQFGDLVGADENGMGDQMDLAAMLGLPTPGTDAYSSASSAGLLSPGPLSSTSSHSSVFSGDGMDNMFSFATSPTYYPTDSNSIDQALASLLEGNQLQNGSSQQQQSDLLTQQINNILSPRHAPQANLGFSSPPYTAQYPSPSTQPAHISPYKANSYDPYQQANIDPALHTYPMQSQGSQVFSPVHPSISNGTLLLSPQPLHYGSNNLTTSGRPMSSPRRLQAMKSAPNLGSMYHDQNQGYNPFISAASPTPRKASLKRARGAYGEEDSEEDYEEYGEGPGGSDESQGDDDYRPMSGPPQKKRSINNLSSQALSQLNTTPNRLRPGPKPKTSMPNLHSHQTVFAVEINAPPVPPLPRAFSQSATSDDADGLQVPQSGISKDQLAEYYHVGVSNKQTKKGRPQRMYICGITGCGKEFPRKSAVESHIQTHLEDKPFACPYDDW